MVTTLLALSLLAADPCTKLAELALVLGKEQAEVLHEKCGADMRLRVCQEGTCAQAPKCHLPNGEGGPDWKMESATTWEHDGVKDVLVAWRNGEDLDVRVLMLKGDRVACRSNRGLDTALQQGLRTRDPGVTNQGKGGTVKVVKDRVVFQRMGMVITVKASGETFALDGATAAPADKPAAK